MCEASTSNDTLSRKRHVLSEDAREIIWNVYNFFKNVHTQGNLLDTVVQATGISKSTVVRILKQGRAIDCGKNSSFATTIPTPKASPKSSVDNCGEQIIRRIVHNFHINEKEKPTVEGIYNKVKDDESIGYLGKKSSFRTLLIKMGFRWKKTMDQRKILMERHDIRSLRCSYIRSIINYRKAGRPIVYTDETYIHASHTTPYSWTDGSGAGLTSPIGKGKRLIIVHAGGEMGFINDALLIFKSGQKSGDYHDDMNFINYKRWLEEQLIPNLPQNSVVVMDNASYHNALAVKHPVSNSKKLEMTTWLTERGITYENSLTKPELYELIKLYKPRYIQYSVDAIFSKNGHTVCRLPPYHPELNPIEKVWGIVKNWVASRNVNFKLDDVEKLAREKFASVCADQWKEVCRHVKEIEEEYMVKEHIMDTVCEKLIISTSGDSSDDDIGLSSDPDE